MLLLSWPFAHLFVVAMTGILVFVPPLHTIKFGQRRRTHSMARLGTLEGLLSSVEITVRTLTQSYRSGMPYIRISDAMNAQVSVAQHHGVPVVSGAA